jgi:hypothetical protein
MHMCEKVIDKVNDSSSVAFLMNIVLISEAFTISRPLVFLFVLI